MALVHHFAFGPVAPVREYMEALDDGDGGQARAISHAQIPDVDAALLDGPALRTATETLGRVSYDVTDRHGKHATIRATYRINGVEATTDFAVHQTEERGIFSTWEMDPITLPTLTVTTPHTSTATLNGIKVGTPGEDTRFAVYYPGVYTAEYASDLLDAPETTTTITSPNPDSPHLELDVRTDREAQTHVDTQVRKYLADCTAQNTLYPTGCPFEYPFSGRVAGEVTWTITQAPQARLTLTEEGTWTLTRMEGTAQISFDSLDLYTGKTTTVTEKVPFTLKATPEVNGKNVTVHFP